MASPPGFGGRGADSRGLEGGWVRKSPSLEQVEPRELAWCPIQSLCLLRPGPLP